MWACLSVLFQFCFNKKFADITPEPVSIKSFDDVDRWYDDHMLYYFQQFKFSLYCATALCGVSKDQLTRGLPLTRAIMNFHVMYQTKKILAQLQARNPGDGDFDPYDNPFSKTEYQKLLMLWKLKWIKSCGLSSILQLIKQRKKNGDFHNSMQFWRNSYQFN